MFWFGINGLNTTTEMNLLGVFYSTSKYRGVKSQFRNVFLGATKRDIICIETNPGSSSQTHLLFELPTKHRLTQR